ncbi:MAG TPA: hypothetical protein VF219_11345, partial [Vicinamibacterales bacterium]
DGQHWLPLKSGLPHAPVHWLTVQEHFSDLVVATYGRGFWIVDDISPLRTLTPEALREPAHLFAPRPAYRFRNITEPMTMPDDASEGRNPPYGAALTFALNTAPKDEDRQKFKITIRDAANTIVRTMNVGKEATAGLNRVWWDLRMDPTDDITLRTPPLHARDFPLGPDGTRKFPTTAALSVLVAPGPYSVTLDTGSVQKTATLNVLKDPNTTGTDQDVAAQTKTMLSIRGNANTVAQMINAAESVRAQLASWRTTIGSKAPADVTAAAEDLEKQIVAIESRLLNLTATGRGQDFLRTQSQMMDKLAHLADVVSYADFAPTDSQIEVAAKLAQDVAHDREQMDGVLARTLASFNAMLRERQLGAIVAPNP